jgi:hypothetical protein
MYSPREVQARNSQLFSIKKSKKSRISSPPFLCPSMGIEKGRRRGESFLVTCSKKSELVSPPPTNLYNIKLFIQTISLVRKNNFDTN